MAWVPTFTLRSADNSTEVYRFTAVQSTNLPQTPRDTVVVTSLRSSGAVVIDGGYKPFDGLIDFVLWDNSGSYEAIMALIDDLETSIPVNTPFILRMDKTSTTWYEYKVKRIVPFSYPQVESDKRLYRQLVSAVFLCGAW
jgi:hypothetical protein